MGQHAAIYARVSTADQSCERQITELTAFAERGGFEVFGIFKETSSGARSNRLARNRVLELAQARRIDAVLVTELSRWGRSTQDLLETLYKLAGWKVSVIAMSGMTFELDTPHGRMMATMLAGIAQFERDLLSERVKSGLAAARARGKKLGRQPGQRPKSDRLAPKVLQAVDGERSCRWIARDLGISENTVVGFRAPYRTWPLSGAGWLRASRSTLRLRWRRSRRSCIVSTPRWISCSRSESPAPGGSRGLVCCGCGRGTPHDTAHDSGGKPRSLQLSRAGKTKLHRCAALCGWMQGAHQHALHTFRYSHTCRSVGQRTPCPELAIGKEIDMMVDGFWKAFMQEWCERSPIFN